MSEKLPTINIKGKEYVQVKDRILYFNENYKNGSITTELLSDLTSKLVIIKATVTPDVSINRQFTGYSQATIGGNGINATAALENCETSAVGRALGMMGIGVIESMASADEVNKALNSETGKRNPPAKSPKKGDDISNWTKEQIEEIVKNEFFLKFGTSKKTGKPWFILNNHLGESGWITEPVYHYILENSEEKDGKRYIKRRSEADRMEEEANKVFNPQSQQGKENMKTMMNL